jgi:hypothetical protein
MEYTIAHDIEIAGKGIGATLTEKELAGWHVSHLLKIGALVAKQTQNHSQKDEK